MAISVAESLKSRHVVLVYVIDRIVQKEDEIHFDARARTSSAT